MKGTKFSFLIICVLCLAIIFGSIGGAFAKDLNAEAQTSSFDEESQYVDVEVAFDSDIICDYEVLEVTFEAAESFDDWHYDAEGLSVDYTYCSGNTLYFVRGTEELT